MSADVDGVLSADPGGSASPDPGGVPSAHAGVLTSADAGGVLGAQAGGQTSADAGGVVSADVPEAGGDEIATIPADKVRPAVPVNPKTGRPVRPASVWIGAVACLLAVVAVAASLLWTYWNAITDFTHASWLMRRFGEQPDILTKVLLSIGITLIALVIGVSNAITGYYAWSGYDWTRIAGIVSGTASLLVLLFNPVGWAAIPLAVLGAGLLWLPSSRAFFAAWNARRHPDVAFAPPVEQVFYGPLPRYR